MTAYFLGNLLGRFIISALIVYVVLLLLNKFQFKPALNRLRRPLPIASILLIFLLGLATSLRAESGRALRPFVVTEIPKAGLSVYVPERPKWQFTTEPRAGTYAVILTTPEKYYPPASMEIVLNHRLRVSRAELEKTAVTALNTVRQNAGLTHLITASDLKPVTYGDIQAYEDHYELQSDGETYSVKSVMGIMPSGRPITMFLATAEGQLSHIEHMSRKIWNKLTELQGKP